MKMYRSVLALFVILTLVIGVLIFMVNEVSSRTPDGQTPAEESICDDFSGAAFGLCNSYCEAMDCDSDKPKASEKACGKVLANFMKKTEGSMPPCVSTGLGICVDDCSNARQECRDACDGDDEDCIEKCQEENGACTCECLSDLSDECSAQCQNSDDPKSCEGDCVVKECEDTCKIIAPPDIQEECVKNCVSPDEVCKPQDPCERVFCEDPEQCVNGICCNAVLGTFCDSLPEGEMCQEGVNCPKGSGCADDQICCALVCEAL